MQSKKKTISDVHVALASLEFHVYVTSEYFCMSWCPQEEK